MYNHSISHLTPGDIFSQFIGRLVSQVEQVVTFILHAYQKYSTGLRVVMETADHVTMDEDYLTRDEFSLHKMIVAVTDVGKVSLQIILPSYNNKFNNKLS